MSDHVSCIQYINPIYLYILDPRSPPSNPSSFPLSNLFFLPTTLYLLIISNSPFPNSTPLLSPKPLIPILQTQSSIMPPLTLTLPKFHFLGTTEPSFSKHQSYLHSINASLTLNCPS